MDSAESLCHELSEHGVQAQLCNGGTAVHLVDKNGEEAWMSVKTREIYSTTTDRIDPVDDLLHFSGCRVRDFRHQVCAWLIVWQSGREQFPDLATEAVLN